MDRAGGTSLRTKALLSFPAAFGFMAAMLFVPAGTFAYWQAWAFLCVMAVLSIPTVAYFFLRAPEFLERRMRFRETREKQRAIIGVAWVVFAIGFVLPGLDHRYGWSAVPVWVTVAADAVMAIGYATVFLVFKENPFASRTIAVDPGQKIVTTGPYAVVRHPMYSGSLLVYLSIAPALGSYWATIPFLLAIPILVVRILDEEALLIDGLKGYREYVRKVPYRLIPGIW
jgi:protein-S-isoprenylcysteine O-methyltransferase Ste14